MTSFDPATRIPVLIGSGEVLDRPEIDIQGMDAIALMLAALQAAEADVGAPVLGTLDWLGVEDEISFPEPAPQNSLAMRLPNRPAHLVKTFEASGDGPIQLINDAAILIARGEIVLAACVGAEALRTAAKRTQADIAAGRGPTKNSVAQVAAENALPLAKKYGLLTPIDVYPLYENAARAAWGQTVSEGQAESGTIWEGFSRVAAANPYAWIRREILAKEIVEPTDDNRMVSFPYTKLMVANASVNMGAAVIIASLAKARELGVPEARLVYIGAGAAAHEEEDFLLRATYTRLPSLEATVEAALKRNQVTARDIDHVELYSCFPIVPKLARRVLDWPLEKPATVYGGLTFGGGPIGNCMMHAAARMTIALRKSGAYGLIVANGGYATHSHSIVFARQPLPEGAFPRSYDVQANADARRGRTPELLAEYEGRGTIETFTIPCDRKGAPRHATIIARTPGGERFLAHVPGSDVAALSCLMNDAARAIGSKGSAERGGDGLVYWTMAPS